MPRIRNPYPAEFREQIVALARTGGAAIELGRGCGFERSGLGQKRTSISAVAMSASSAGLIDQAGLAQPLCDRLVGFWISERRSAHMIDERVLWIDLH